MKGLCNARIKRVKSRTWRSAEFVAWSMLEIFVYLSRPFRSLPPLVEVGSQLLSDIENLGSALSRKVRSAILIFLVVIRWMVTKLLAKRGLYVSCAHACVWINEYPILPQWKLSQVPQKRLNCYRQSSKFFINWCQLLEMGTC